MEELKNQLDEKSKQLTKLTEDFNKYLISLSTYLQL